MIIDQDSPTRRDLYHSAILSLWDKGLDTWQIAQTIGDTEADVERALHVAIDRRVRSRENYYGETT
jgi:hypothetical protein